MYKTCFHLHTYFSDGKGTPEEYMEEALNQKFSHIGYSDHAPVPFDNPWSLKSCDKDEYLATTEPLRNIYNKELKIFRSLEADFIPGISTPFKELKEEYDTDYLIGSVHLVRNGNDERLWFIDGSVETEYFKGFNEIFERDIKKGVTAFYHQQMEMIEVEKPEVLGHFDKVVMHNKGRLFQEDEPWILSLQKELLDLVKQYNIVVEVNTRGIYKGRYHTTYPSPFLIKLCNDMAIPMIISSDAHKPSEISGYYPETIQILEKLEVKELCIFEDGEFVPVSITLFDR